MLRFAVLAVALAGCGRVAFEPRSGATDGVLTYRDAVLADSPLAYWRLNDDGAIAHDEMGHFDGTAVGNCARHAPGALTGDADGALQFDGTSCMVTVSDQFTFPGTTSFTIELWASETSITHYHHFFTVETRVGSNPMDGYALLQYPPEANQVKLERVVASTQLAAHAGTIATGRFVYLVGVYDASVGELIVYIDGVAQPPEADARPMTSFNTPGIMGAVIAGYGMFDGVLDEVALYDHVLPPERIQLHRDIATIGPQ